MDDPLRDATVYCKNRERLLKGEVAQNTGRRGGSAIDGRTTRAEHEVVVQLFHQQPLAAEGVENLQQQSSQQLLGWDRGWRPDLSGCVLHGRPQPWTQARVPGLPEVMNADGYIMPSAWKFKRGILAMVIRVRQADGP